VNEKLSPTAEVQRLVDLMFDCQIDASGIDRMQSLMRQDHRCLQAYVQRLDFHSELLDQSDHKSAEATALNALQQMVATNAKRESRQYWQATLLLTACATMLFVGLSWIYYSTILVPPAVGTIASLSTNLQSSTEPLELGQIVRLRQTISLPQGIATIQLPHLMLDVVGPASIRFERNNRVSLAFGTILAKVQPEGIGFTVKTPETEVVDLGTEFLVEHTSEQGTYVSVRRGVAQANVLDRRGIPTKVLDLTASRAAQIHQSSQTAKEVSYSAEHYRPVDQSRGGIRRLTGTLRTVAEVPQSMASEQLVTPNHMLVLPEKQVILTSPLTVESLNGPVTIPAGTTVRSYLIHYDPTALVLFAPRGAVTYWGNIAALIVKSSGLSATDDLFGLPGVTFETREFRQLELDEDEIQISDDRKTVSFFFGVSPPEFLDQARVLVIEESP